MSGNGVPGLRLILYSCKGYTLRVVVVVVLSFLFVLSLVRDLF